MCKESNTKLPKILQAFNVLSVEFVDKNYIGIVDIENFDIR